MALDNLTLLFSLTLVSGLMAVSLAVTSHKGGRDGLRLWSIALALEAVAWSMVAAGWMMPRSLSLSLTNLSLVAAMSVKLAAVYEFRGLRWPYLLSLLPLAAMLLLVLVLDTTDVRGRIFFGSLIFAAQMAMLAQALYRDDTTRGGRAWWLIYGATLLLLMALLLRAVAALTSAESFSLPLSQQTPNAVQVVMFVSVVVLDLLGALGFILLVKERIERTVQQHAMTDGLTGIFNRRAFMARADRELAIAQRKHQPLSLLIFDIDHFKRINDTYGHAAGDAALVEISGVVGRRLRQQDTFGRYGGEEFCILLPDTGEQGALVLAEDLRKLVEATPVQIGTEQVVLTISLGVCVCGAGCIHSTDDFNMLLNDADRALYQSKAQGRNRTVSTLFQCKPEGCNVASAARQG
jgi:diguanylate cyclase (GGDEF)-like protein